MGNETHPSVKVEVEAKAAAKAKEMTQKDANEDAKKTTNNKVTLPGGARVTGDQAGGFIFPGGTTKRLKTRPTRTKRLKTKGPTLMPTPLMTKAKASIALHNLFQLWPTTTRLTSTQPAPDQGAQVPPGLLD